MKYDIEALEALVNEGFLRKSVKDDLMLYGYTDRCTFERHWTDLTRAARGLILDPQGRAIAIPFPKFFNLNEMPETEVKNLPQNEYVCYEKLDGSLGILFNYKDEWHISTRGSFYSEQAVKAKEILSKYDLSRLDKLTTFLVEIIYPENKIVVDYGQEEKLVLLGAVDTTVGKECALAYLQIAASKSGMPMANVYKYSIEEMIALQKTLPKNNEGFVVRWAGGFRVKIKGEEYLKIHKMISNMSLLSFWESMEAGIVNKQYLAQLPEEFRSEFEPMVESLETSYLQIMKEIEEDVAALPTRENTKEAKKAIGMFVQGQNSLKHPTAMFPYINKSVDGLNKYVMRTIRPTGNSLRVTE